MPLMYFQCYPFIAFTPKYFPLISLSQTGTINADTWLFEIDFAHLKHPTFPKIPK